MSRLFELFKYSKMLKIKDGELTLMNTYINIIPTALLCDLQKGLVQSWGLEKAYDAIYKSAKRGSAEYNKDLIKKQGFTNKRKIFDWQMRVVTFSGWGVIEPSKIDFKNISFKAHYHDSPFTKEYGKSNYPVDFIPMGFTAGGVSQAVGKDVDAVETKCMAMGHPYCEIELGLPKIINKKRLELWRKWKLI